LTGKSIGFQNGTTGSMYISGNEDWGYDGFSNITPKGYNTALLAAMDLVNGNIYGVVVDNAPAAAIVKAINGTNQVLKVIDISLTNEQYAYVLKKK